jgi:hypothetical protein
MSSERYKNLVKLIKNQTNYTDEEAIEKLNEWGNDYIKVIKEYLDPNFQNRKIERKKMSTNQKMMSEIRNFMDEASETYINGKNGIETNEEKLRKQLAINAANQHYKNESDKQ